MPAQVLTVYPGSTFDLSFGGAGFPWTTAPTPAGLSDPSDDPTDSTFGLFNPSTVDARDCYAEFKLALGISGIVSIASVRLVAWVMATGTGGTYDTPVTAVVRPTGSGSGATGAYESAPLTLTSESAAVEIFHALEFPPWTVNPATSVAWTLSDLAALAFGVHFAAPATGIATASIKLGRLRMLVECTSIAANTEAVRTLLSMPLRLFSRGLDRGKITGPALLADIGLGEVFTLEHDRGRRPGGPGWGRLPWQRASLVAEQIAVDFLTGRTTIDWHNLRRPATRLWLPGLTNLGFSLDALGIPILHSGGGGPAVARASVKYIERPGNPTDHVMQAVTEDLLAHDYRGMCFEAGGDTNLVLNSTGSQGAAGVFDNWTKTMSGTGLVFDGGTAASIGVDETGLRRSIGIGVGATPGSQAYVTQAVAITNDFRLGIRTYNSSGVGKLSAVAQRASDSWFWDDATEAWVAGIAYNRIGLDAGGFRMWCSALIPGGADTITVSIGYFGEGGDGNYGAALWSVDLVEGVDHIGSHLLTTTAAVTRVADVAAIPNGEAVRWWGHERGFSGVLTFTPLWNADDVQGGSFRVVLRVDYGNGNYAEIYFHKGGVEGGGVDYYGFAIYSDGTGYIAQYVVADRPDLEPMRDRPVKLSWYWVGPLGELGLPPGQIAIAANNDWSPVTALLPSVPTMDPVSTGYLGSNGAAAWANGHVSNLDVSPFLLAPAEMARKP